MGVHARIPVAEVTVLDLQERLHPRHVIKYNRAEARPVLVRNVSAQPEVVVAPNANRSARGKKRSNLGRAIWRSEGVASISDRHYSIDAPSEQQVKRPRQFGTVVVDISD
jgi:hypothetical protein